MNERESEHEQEPNENAGNPAATEDEQEQARQGRQQEEDAMRGAGHEDPDKALERTQE
jgi:hypothetical protein